MVTEPLRRLGTWASALPSSHRFVSFIYLSWRIQISWVLLSLIRLIKVNEDLVRINPNFGPKMDWFPTILNLISSRLSLRGINNETTGKNCFFSYLLKFMLKGEWVSLPGEKYTKNFSNLLFCSVFMRHFVTILTLIPACPIPPIHIRAVFVRLHFIYFSRLLGHFSCFWLCLVGLPVVGLPAQRL